MSTSIWLALCCLFFGCRFCFKSIGPAASCCILLLLVFRNQLLPLQLDALRKHSVLFLFSLLALFVRFKAFTVVFGNNVAICLLKILWLTSPDPCKKKLTPLRVVLETVGRRTVNAERGLKCRSYATLITILADIVAPGRVLQLSLPVQTIAGPSSY